MCIEEITMSVYNSFWLENNHVTHQLHIIELYLLTLQFSINKNEEEWQVRYEAASASQHNKPALMGLSSQFNYHPKIQI